MKRVSVVTPCFNEEENVREVYERTRRMFAQLGRYRYEHLFIDNASTDGTVAVLKEIARDDRNVKIIVNARNFGHIRSPYYGLLQARGDAVIGLVADLQDPPERIPDLLKKWEDGFNIVLGVKPSSEENRFMFSLRKAFYNLIAKLSDIEQVKNFSGFGLYDKCVIDVLRKIDDPNPYFRGLLCDIGFSRAIIEYNQAVRRKGITKNNFYTLYDLAMLGFTNHSKIPLRMAICSAFFCAILSLAIGLGYFVEKMLYWKDFQLGLAPLVIGLFFLGSVQMFFVGILGEYIGAIHTQVLHRPLVIERERINFEDDAVPWLATPADLSAGSQEQTRAMACPEARPTDDADSSG